MGCTFYFLNAFLILILFSQQAVAGDDEDDEYCDCVGMIINGDAASCSDEASVLASLSIIQVPPEDDGPEKVVLTGNFNVTKEVPKEQSITMSISLDLLSSGGKECVWSGSMKFCELMEEKSDPLKDFVDCFGGECPIPVDIYKVAEMMMNMDFIAEYMTEQWCGKYIMRMEIKNAMDVILCMEMGAVVDVMQRKCSKCQSDERRRRK